MIERINRILSEKQLTPSQFADAIGIQRSGMSHLLSGRNNPSLEFILKTLKTFPDIDPVWLLLGENIKEQLPAPQVVNGKLDLRVDENTDPDHQKKLEQVSEPKSVKSVKEKKSLKGVEKIVVFYDDKTFCIYGPE